MKKLYLFVIVGILVVLCGCGGKESEPVYDEPPLLMIANGQSEAEAEKFGYTWETRKDNGKSVIKIADSTDPLLAADNLPVISIRPAYVSTINPMNAYLMFEIVPDKVTARCWDTELYVEEAAEIELFDAYLENGTYCPDVILKLKNKNCIYEVTAEWNSREEFAGMATYCFRTDGGVVDWVSAIVIK